MESICRGFIEVIRQEAKEVFPPSTRGKKGKEDFNVTKFSEMAFGEGSAKKWRRYVSNPRLVTLEDAWAMARALDKPLIEIIVKSQDKERQLEKMEGDGQMPVKSQAS